MNCVNLNNNIHETNRANITITKEAQKFSLFFEQTSYQTTTFNLYPGVSWVLVPAFHNVIKNHLIYENQCYYWHVILTLICTVGMSKNCCYQQKIINPLLVFDEKLVINYFDKNRP